MKKWLQLGALVLTATCGGLTNLNAQTELRMTIPVHALAFYPIYVAEDRGFFAKEGIKLELVATQGDGPDVDALISGTVQFTTSTPNRLLTAYLQGRPLKAVMSVMNRFTNYCYISKKSAEKVGFKPDQSIDEKVKRLKGLTIGGTRPGSTTFLLAQYYLKRANLVPQQDATVLGIGGGQALLAALENGRIDVSCFASPGVEQAVARGNALVFINHPQGEDPALKEFLFELLYVRPDYAEKNPETVKKVVKALVDANQWIQTAKIEDHLEILRKRFPGIEDAILIESIKNTIAAIEPSGCITPAALSSAVKFMRDVGAINNDVPFNAVVDNSFNQACKK